MPWVCGGQPTNPGDKKYNEDILLLVIPTMTYSEKVLVMVGSEIIDWAMGVITNGELVKGTRTWRQAHFGAVMAMLLQLFHTSSNGTGVEKEVIHSFPGIDTVEVMEFCLDDAWGPVHTTWRVTIPTSVLLVYTAVPVSGDTVCGFTYWQNQHQAPSCLHQWCQLQPTEN